MKRGLVVKIVLGLLLIIVLVILGFRMVSSLTTLVVDVFSGAEIPEEGYENELYTPEPMPTMPDYMRDDSFYDDAGSVEFGDE